MQIQIPQANRVFKTAWFAKAARKMRIDDAHLCKAVHEVMQGQADDLGGGVFEKRLNNNQHRSIILAKTGNIWVFEYVFAKKGRANIDEDELTSFRKLAKSYANLTEQQIMQLIVEEFFMEICHAKQTIQE